jgi:glycosyltransferase involved in cell wall biosynthesis
MEYATSSLLLSVAICTHNPRHDYFERTLNSLKCQDLPRDNWELIIVDNASALDLASHITLDWQKKARIVRENTVGLVHARLAAFRQTSTPLVVFSDDDNILSPSYLSEALKSFFKFPQLGAFGASVSCEYEQPIEAPQKFIDFFSDPSGGIGGIWSNDVEHEKSNPIGAGLCVRREVGTRFQERVANDPRILSLGRIGSQLLSYEDTEIVRTACMMGLGKGILSELKLVHLIGSNRTKCRYLIRLAEGHAFSREIFQFIGDRPISRENFASRIRYLLNLSKSGRLRRQLVIAERRGRKKARQYLTDYLKGITSSKPVSI